MVKLGNILKKNNGPEISDLKYRVSQLGNHLDITHKYKESKNRVVMLSIPTYRADMYFNGKEYKFISVRYLMLRDKGKCYIIDSKEYKKEKNKKGIDENYDFIFSLYTGDILEIERKDGSIEKVKFKGVNNDERKCIEVDNIERNYGSYIELIRDIVAKKEEAEKKGSRYNFEEDLSLIIGTTLTKDEGEKILKSTPISSKQKNCYNRW